MVGLEDDQEGVGGRGARLELVGEGAEVAGLAGDVGGGEVGEVVEAGVGVADEEVDVAVEGVGPVVATAVLELGEPHLGGGVGAGAELVEHGAGVAVAAGAHLLAEDGLAAEPALADPRVGAVGVAGEGVEALGAAVRVVGGVPDLVAVGDDRVAHRVDGVVHHLEEVVVGVAARDVDLASGVGGALVALALEEDRVLGGAVAEVDDVDLGEGLDEDGRVGDLARGGLRGDVGGHHDEGVAHRVGGTRVREGDRLVRGHDALVERPGVDHPPVVARVVLFGKHLHVLPVARQFGGHVELQTGGVHQELLPGRSGEHDLRHHVGPRDGVEDAAVELGGHLREIPRIRISGRRIQHVLAGRHGLVFDVVPQLLDVDPLAIGAVEGEVDLFHDGGDHARGRVDDLAEAAGADVDVDVVDGLEGEGGAGGVGDGGDGEGVGLQALARVGGALVDEGALEEGDVGGIAEVDLAAHDGGVEVAVDEEGGHLDGDLEVLPGEDGGEDGELGVGHEHDVGVGLGVGVGVHPDHEAAELAEEGVVGVGREGGGELDPRGEGGLLDVLHDRGGRAHDGGGAVEHGGAIGDGVEGVLEGDAVGDGVLVLAGGVQDGVVPEGEVRADDAVGAGEGDHGVGGVGRDVGVPGGGGEGEVEAVGAGVLLGGVGVLEVVADQHLALDGGGVPTVEELVHHVGGEAGAEEGEGAEVAAEGRVEGEGVAEGEGGLAAPHGREGVEGAALVEVDALVVDHEVVPPAGDDAREVDQAAAAGVVDHEGAALDGDAGGEAEAGEHGAGVAVGAEPHGEGEAALHHEVGVRGELDGGVGAAGGDAEGADEGALELELGGHGEEGCGIGAGGGEGDGALGVHPEREDALLGEEGGGGGGVGVGPHPAAYGQVVRVEALAGGLQGSGFGGGEVDGGATGPAGRLDGGADVGEGGGVGAAIDPGAVGVVEGPEGAHAVAEIQGEVALVHEARDLVLRELALVEDDVVEEPLEVLGVGGVGADHEVGVAQLVGEVQVADLAHDGVVDPHRDATGVAVQGEGDVVPLLRFDSEVFGNDVRHDFCNIWRHI